jgi:hypothetical protein
MTDLRLVAQVKPLENGRFMPTVVIKDNWGGENVFLGSVAASHAEALEAALRLISAASVQEPTVFELPLPWK